MAAAAEVAAQPPVTAEVVGNAFVTQYYHILHLSPGFVHRFYQDVSKLGRPEEDGSMTITTTMQAINEKLLALNYGDFRSEIKSVDSQESFRGGINVLVTGYMTAKDNSGRYFAQSFFLAPQDRGYFVLNDMFRYLDSSPSYPAVVTEIVVLTSPEPVPENKTPPAEEAVVGEVCNPSENGDVPIVEEEAPVAEVVDQVEDDTWMIVESSARVEELKHKALT